MKDKTMLKKIESGDEPGKTISRRDFLKYGVGVAAVAAGATALMGRIPLPAQQSRTPPTNESSEPIVVSVKGDQLTVMSGHNAVKARDPGLAAQIAEKLQ